VVAYAKVDDSAVTNGGKYSESVAVVFLEGEVTTPFHEGGLNLCLRERGMSLQSAMLHKLCMAALTEDLKWHCVATIVMQQTNARDERFLCSPVMTLGTFTVVSHDDIATTTLTPETTTNFISPLAKSDVPLEIVIPVAIAALLIMIALVFFFAVVQPRRAKRRDAERQAEVQAMEQLEAANKPVSAEPDADEAGARGSDGVCRRRRGARKGEGASPPTPAPRPSALASLTTLAALA
jgi:hypothetical protein